MNPLNNNQQKDQQPMTTKFQQYARNNYKPLEPIDEMWHPEIIAECGVMNKEELDRKLAEEEKRKAEKARIRLLQAEVSHLEQPARIEHLAGSRLEFA